MNPIIQTKQEAGLPEHLKLEVQPAADQEAVVADEHYRFTVLTPQLIRMEYSESGRFEDRATQTVVNRLYPVPEFEVIDQEHRLQIMTKYLRVEYDKGPFTRHGLSIQVRNGDGHLLSVWRYGDAELNWDGTGANLGGTARTLDNADGAIPLEPGLLSRSGYSVIDDSRSLVLKEDGQVEPREAAGAAGLDLYLFGYGHEYLACLRDFYHLCGRTPLLPRYALGNWWSRYYRYTEDEYKVLFERFGQEQIPFSVAVLDMDWHLVEIDPQYGSGWTGYTWNRELFPDPKGLLEWLHQNGQRVTLNVHPADGVRAFEEPYLAMAADLGVDIEQGEAVEFDITDPKFLQAYFKYLHHPLEEEGVDFWWIDWQQGGVTKVPGLDPLWMLNHYHFLDSGRRGSRKITFSRYAGLGSHRYPVGFSGDTIVTWESLDFQPYFTATASNAGYGWWSHDIGGHMLGYLDDELAARWVQFGVFSPILRLHSSASPFNSKEPWRFNPIAEQVMKQHLRLRHRLLPYLYTMNRYASRDGLPLVQPMYYRHAKQHEAYEVPNQYYFGTELIACLVTRPMHREIGVAEVKAWLPEGRWIDFFKGRVYDGGRKLSLYRDLEHIPVLAKAGAIVPMADFPEFTHSTENPAQLEVRIFAGADGRFELWEDAGDTAEDRDENWCRTEMVWTWEAAEDGQGSSLTILPAEGNLSVVPERRSWKLVFCGVAETEVKVLLNEVKGACAGGVSETNGAAESSNGAKESARVIDSSYDEQTHTLTVMVPEVSVNESLTVRLADARLAENRVVDEVFALLDRAQIRFQLKEQIYKLVKETPAPSLALPSLAAMELELALYGALCEILCARY
ncbi:glycoside hydrolase family 31 protein [Paenibacillus physcomitrellae]|uniref:Alpha-glucosidase n=1 Tax=Paenibacillus physcomitrellae TaxID=1619311 RepID=A0ABQ1GPZ1_9BACL|nr:TIM-barrel domain-containing protein [Paenibacillus physcomitrellae]GGA48156.1 alpha-glucosidase [Paenibacillus physcomitrellae]